MANNFITKETGPFTAVVWHQALSAIGSVHEDLGSPKFQDDCELETFVMQQLITQNPDF